MPTLKASLPQPASTPEPNGQTALQSKKSEINQHAVHAGLSVPSKLCLIDFASFLDNLTKLESHLKIFLSAVTHAVKVVTEVTLELLGHTSRTPVSFLVIFMETLFTANHTLSHHVPTTPPQPSTQHALETNIQPQPARSNAQPHQAEPTQTILERVNQLTTSLVKQP